jgi:hypothetical protein
MAKQKIEVTIDIPDEYEPTGEYRVPQAGEHYLSMQRRVWRVTSENETAGYQKFILRRKEPLAIQACRKIIAAARSFRAQGLEIGTLIAADELADKAIADFERESK